MHTIKDSTLIQENNPAKIIEALSTNTGLRSWWTTDLDSDCEKHEATFRFEPELGSVKSATFRMDGVDERRVAMTCTAHSEPAGWLGTTLTFTLVPDGARTRVDLEHAGYPANNELYAQCIKGWSYFLGSLKSYVETGAGTPHVRASHKAA